MSKEIIINRLLDKYESSKHLYEPGVSNRRVMLRTDPRKKEFLEYDYENATVRDAFNEAAKELERQHLLAIQWLKGRPVLECITLNIDAVMECYKLVGRTHPKELATKIAALVREELKDATTDWIVAWRDDTCIKAGEEFKVPAYCKKDLSQLETLLVALRAYDLQNGEPTTMRAFSSRCYHDTKFFERNVRDLFLQVARKYYSAMAEVCEHEDLGVRDQLAYLGIYARPELYELAGNVTIHTRAGSIDLNAAGDYGLALPSTVVDDVVSFKLNAIRSITFIENKTNYDEYIRTEKQHDELIVYHGGFISPKKRALFSKLALAARSELSVYFWGDIDLGGFQMYEQLQKTFPNVKPMRMSEAEVKKYHHNGLARTEEYLCKLRASHFNHDGSCFKSAIDKITEYGVTIEQEAFLTDTAYTLAYI